MPAQTGRAVSSRCRGGRCVLIGLAGAEGVRPRGRLRGQGSLWRGDAVVRGRQFNRGGGRPASGGRPRAGLRTPKMGTRRKIRKPNRNDVGKSQIANPNQGGAFPPIPLSEGREVRRPADGGALRGPRRASPLRFPFLPRRPAGAPAMPGRLERDSRPRPSSESTGSAQSSRQVFFRVDQAN